MIQILLNLSKMFAVKDANFKEMLDFLNSCMDEGEQRKSNDTRSLFGLVRGSFCHPEAKLCYMEGDKTNSRLMIGSKLIRGMESRKSYTFDKWDITDKVVMVTTNAQNIQNAITDQLHFLHLGCVGHTLQVKHYSLHQSAMFWEELENLWNIFITLL